MDSHGVEILHVADDGAVVILVPHDFVLDLLPLVEVFFDEDLSDSAIGESSLRYLLQFRFVEGDSTTLPSQSIGDSDDDRVSDLFRRCDRAVKVGGFLALWNWNPVFLHCGLEEFSIVSEFDAPYARSEDS